MTRIIDPARMGGIGKEDRQYIIYLYIVKKAVYVYCTNRGSGGGYIVTRMITMAVPCHWIPIGTKKTLGNIDKRSSPSKAKHEVKT